MFVGGIFNCEAYILPALENSLLKCLRGLGAPPGGTANIGLANTAKADQALDNCGTLNCEAYKGECSEFLLKVLVYSSSALGSIILTVVPT